MQREITVLSETRRPKQIDAGLIAACRHRLDAIRLCIQLSGLAQETIAEQLNIDPGHLSRILAGRANFPDAKSIDLMTLCGNIAPCQYEAHALNLKLTADEKAQRKAELIAELERLEAAA